MQRAPLGESVRANRSRSVFFLVIGHHLTLSQLRCLGFQCPREETPHSAIISIGPHTDAALDSLKISDQVIPQLRFLVRFVRSSQWADKLQEETFGFPAKTAQTLSCALLKDLSPKLDQVRVLDRARVQSNNSLQRRASNAVDRITLLLTFLTFMLLLMSLLV
jgi:hypothetical protein